MWLTGESLGVGTVHFMAGQSAARAFLFGQGTSVTGYKDELLRADMSNLNRNVVLFVSLQFLLLFFFNFYLKL